MLSPTSYLSGQTGCTPAAKIIQDALGIESDDVANYVFPKTWPRDREQRARIIGASEDRCEIMPIWQIIKLRERACGMSLAVMLRASERRLR